MMAIFPLFTKMIIYVLVEIVNGVLDKNHEKPLASFEAQGHAAGLNAEPACLIGTRSPLIPAAAVGARPLQTPQGKNK
ncbi:MAG: hypothetical protein MR881_05885 [Bacteroidales bacterium]|nr:hypothetical protein [Bacteroidales bacterium]